MLLLIQVSLEIYLQKFINFLILKIYSLASLTTCNVVTSSVAGGAFGHMVCISFIVINNLYEF